LIASFLFCTVAVFPELSWAAHPLITDDAWTQGKGRFQLEVNGQYERDEENADGISVKARGGQFGSTLSYGIVENTDLVLTLPYQWGKIEENGVTTYDERGISDAVFETKWRFFEKDGLGLALKPGISIPTGNDEKGLGTGKVGYQVFFIGSKAIEHWSFHANLGYLRNENKIGEQRNIWHASLASTWEVIKDLNLVANIGIERNPDDSAKNNPAFLIGGFIYSLFENFDIDCGFKYGLTSSEVDNTFLAGITLRF
jgi:hypothetical protein